MNSGLSVVDVEASSKNYGKVTDATPPYGYERHPCIFISNFPVILLLVLEEFS